MSRLYRYVGPKEIAERLSAAAAGTRIESVEDLLRWTRDAGLAPGNPGAITATFVVDESGVLRLADRRSEHFACAGGKPVLSAGEITFFVSKGAAEVTSVTNQSTGYCPEPESWPAVRQALERAALAAPDDLSQKFVFRRCESCGSINIVKDSAFNCDVCSAALPSDWNLDAEVGQLVSGR